MALPYSEIPVDKCRRNEGDRQSSMGKHHSNYSYKDYPWMLKSVVEHDEKRDICMVSKCLFRRYLLSTKEKWYL